MLRISMGTLRNLTNTCYRTTMMMRCQISKTKNPRTMLSLALGSPKSQRSKRCSRGRVELFMTTHMLAGRFVNVQSVGLMGSISP